MAITTNGGAGVTADAVATLTNKTLVSPVIQDPTITGTTTNINTTNLVVEDKNIVINDVVSPSDVNADGGGISLSGTTTKTLNWVDATDAWTSSEHLDLASGKSYYVNGTLLKNVSETLTNKTISGASNTLTVRLANDVSGTLPLANGGTGATSAPAAMASLMGYTSTATAAGTTTLTNASSYYQQFTGTTTQTVVLPVTSTLTTGWTFHIVNNSTGLVTVQSSGTNQVIIVPANTTAMVTCIATAGTTASDWESGITDFSTYTGSGNVVLATSPSLTTPIITLSYSAKTANYTFVAGDEGNIFSMNNASAQQFSIPTDATYNFAIGTQFNVFWITGAGQPTIGAVTSGTTTVISTGATSATPKLRVANSMATALKIAANTWIVTGDIS